MNNDQKNEINKWLKVLKLYINPVELMDIFPDLFPLGSPPRNRVMDKYEQPHEAVEIVVRELLQCHSECNLYQRFIGAVRETGHSWLSELMTGKTYGIESEMARSTMESAEYVINFFTLILPHIKSIIQPQDVAYALRARLVFTEEDVTQVEAKIQDRGAHAAVRHMLAILVRKAPGWWRDFADIIKNLRYDADLVNSLYALQNDMNTSSSSSSNDSQCVTVSEGGNANNAAASSTSYLPSSGNDVWPRPRLEDFHHIVQITSSPAVERGKREEEVVKHQLHPNLDTHKDITIKVPLEHKHDPFMFCIGKTMDKIVLVLYSLDLQNIEGLPEPNFLLKGSQQYIQWCQLLTRKAVQCRSQTGAELSRNIQLCSFYLKVFNEALDLHFKCRAIDALNFLKSQLKYTQDKNLNKMENRLRYISKESIEELENCYRDPACVNDNLIKMEKEISRTFQTDSDSRAILNVSKWQYAKVLRDWLNESKVLIPLHLNAECFNRIGNNKEGCKTKLAHHEQKLILEILRNTKILVCTPGVASEGMDIINLVLRYDCV